MISLWWPGSRLNCHFNTFSRSNTILYQLYNVPLTRSKSSSSTASIDSQTKGSTTLGSGILIILTIIVFVDSCGLIFNYKNHSLYSTILSILSDFTIPDNGKGTEFSFGMITIDKIFKFKPTWEIMFSLVWNKVFHYFCYSDRMG